MSTTGTNHYYQQDDEPFFYYNTGTDATPAWVSITDAEEISWPVTKGQVERKPRGSKFTLKRGGKKEAVLTFNLLKTRAQDDVFDAIWDSYCNDTPINFALTDKAIAEGDANGISAWCEVFEFSNAAGSGENGVVHEISAEPTDYVEAGSLIHPSLIQDPGT